VVYDIWVSFDEKHQEILRLLAEDRAECAPSQASKDSLVVSTNVPPLVIETLLRRGWPAAAALVRSRARDLAGMTVDDLDADMWSDDRERSKSASRRLAERLTALGYHGEALAARLLTVDPQQPTSFRAVMPGITAALKTADSNLRAQAAPIIGIWWRARGGVYLNNHRSIFSIAWEETSGVRRQPQPDLAPLFARRQPEPPPQAPGVVVMPKDKSTKLVSGQLEYKDLVDARLPLVVARDLAGVRRTLLAEYPHAVNAVDLMLRDLREGEPVRVKPILLCGPAGTGKSRVVRRLFSDLLGLGVYRYDGASSSDNMFGGSPKGWSNTQPSAPARAVNQFRIANPIVMVDEIEKSGSSPAGSLKHAMLPFLERETAARYRDVSLDAEMDLSWVSHFATANDVTDLPAPLKDRYRVVKVPLPRLVDLPALAANVLAEIAAENGDFASPLAADELDVVGRAWTRAGFSIRKLQKIVSATIEARNAAAVRH
jgi:ATP-dependent Lon protease